MSVFYEVELRQLVQVLDALNKTEQDDSGLGITFEGELKVWDFGELKGRIKKTPDDGVSLESMWYFSDAKAAEDDQ